MIPHRPRLRKWARPIPAVRGGLWYNSAMFAAMLLCALAFAETKTLAVQICLDRAGCSCNTIDGQWGRKSQRALEAYCRARRLPTPPTPEAAYDTLFSASGNLFRLATVTPADIAAVVPMPDTPARKAQLRKMGYGSVLEMFAERGHLSRRAMERMNPGVDWERVAPGLKLVIPAFPPMEEELAVWPKDRPHAPRRPEAALVKVSLSRFEISAFDAGGRLLAIFPCSIAQSKAKLPPQGELRITETIANPNYTYTPDHVPPGGKARRYIFPAGPRCPVGVAWLGLNLPGYGIHGTPCPESIGNAESHGCFRLANWNAARLYALCRPGVRVVIER